MSVEELNSLFGSGQTGVDAEVFLRAIARLSDSDKSEIAALCPSPLAIAAMHARRPSGITVARTFQATPQPHSIRLDCPPLHVLVTTTLVDTDLSLANDGKLLVGGKLAAGTVAVTGPGRQLMMHTRTACDLLHLAVPVCLLRRPRGRQHELDGFVMRDALMGRIVRLLCEAPASWLFVYAELLSQLAVTRVLQLAPEPPLSCLPAWRVKKVKAFVEANLAEPLRLSDLAAACGLSRMHFAAQFRAATGMRPHDYVLSRRIEHAKRLMTEGKSTLVEIALDAGFQSQAHFCTIFKRLTGNTPSSWRRQHTYASEFSKSGYGFSQTAGRLPAAAFLSPPVAVRAAVLRPDAHWA